MSHNDPALPQIMQPEEDIRFPSRPLSDGSRLMMLVVLLGVLTLGLRVISLRQNINEVVVNPLLLKAAMQAAAPAIVEGVCSWRCRR